MEKALTHVKFRFPPPLLGTLRREFLSRDDSRVQEGFHWVIKDQIHFALAGNEGIKDRMLYEQRDGRSDNEFPRRDERRKCGDCSEMRRFGVKGDLLESFSVLNIQAISRKSTTRGAGHTAVATSDSSASSYFPPGKAVWPGCERRFFDRVVSNTLNNPSLSNNRIKTAARLLFACSGLYKGCRDASQPQYSFDKISLATGVFIRGGSRGD